MAIIRVVKDNFNQGELGPFLLGRDDNPIYEAGALTAENWMLLPQGGIIRRPGFQNIDGVGPLVPPPPPPPPPPPGLLCAHLTPGSDLFFDSLLGIAVPISGVNPSRIDNFDGLGASGHSWMNTGLSKTAVGYSGGITKTSSGAVITYEYDTAGSDSTSYHWTGAYGLAVDFDQTITSTRIWGSVISPSSYPYGVKTLPTNIEFGASLTVDNAIESGFDFSSGGRGNYSIGFAAYTKDSIGNSYGGTMWLTSRSISIQPGLGVGASAENRSFNFLDSASTSDRTFFMEFQVHFEDGVTPTVCYYLQRDDGLWLGQGSSESGPPVWQEQQDAFWKGDCYINPLQVGTINRLFVYNPLSAGTSGVLNFDEIYMDKFIYLEAIGNNVFVKPDFEVSAKNYKVYAL